MPEPEPWVIRETLYGRWTTLSGGRKTLVAAGALLAVSGLVGVGALLVSSSLFSGSGTRTDQAEDTEIRNAPKPSLILPTGGSSEPRPSTTGSASPSRSPEPTARTRTPSAEPSRKPADGDGDGDSVTYAAWAGHGCDSPAKGGYQEIGRYYDGVEGWYTVDSGGYDEGACDGSFAAVPMSGSRTDDHDNRALWWWSVGGDSDKCAVGVYVPWSSDARDVGGDPTTYEVLSDPDDRDSAYASFEIDQAASLGLLVNAGTYTVKDGRIAVKMLDRGQDWDAHGPTYAHHAAGQMKVTCR
ncbi:adhesin [Streptomyces sp. 7N604]|uniref:adhesin n=1 Tax=Streptomyces sp. 7N604 TaxID=3457415 RepID=UPI003FCF3472